MAQSESAVIPLDELVDGLASIKRMAFKSTVGIFFGLSILSVLARAGIRLRTRRTLSLDDYLLFAAAVFLSAATGLMYNICDNLYLSTAIRLDTSIVGRLGIDRLMSLVNSAVQENHSFLILAWTATFLVKFSFLAFFKQLIWNVAGVRRYYWTVVAVTVISWLFLIAEPFILCSSFGMESLQCFEESKNLLYISMTGLVTGLDAITDLMIVSIPIIVLHRARMRTSQKVALGVFLCLSLVMVVFSITRVSKISGVSGVDVPWVFFWQFMEASIAVLMGSLTVFRTLLISESNKRRGSPPGGGDGKGASPGGGGGSPWKRPRDYYAFHHRIRFLGRSKEHGDLESQDGLPDIPGGTMTGLRTFIRRNNRDSGVKTGAMLTEVSQHSTLAEEDSMVLSGKEKEEKAREEVRQLSASPVPRNPPIAYHYPIWRPQPVPVQGQVGTHEDAPWTDASPQATQTSLGGTTVHDRRGS
ncbi:hypothetical protein C8A00DRAFT_36475 [Chaetomidium leptoderma]|uniref:Rhodopsin domain-containing protein n=1 Tax=Chaetomidium leptoderma TaxID=669021 RepID=A0AAN6VGL3_9PEZI|nr:hypothetical protein C8A00DRAFT_36475 [Chaetomidium leptoderma]